jgi:hypothetical protein
MLLFRMPSPVSASNVFKAAVLFCFHLLVCSEEPRPLFVEGYAGKVSYAPGETLSLHVSTSAAEFSAEIVRLGGR